MILRNYLPQSSVAQFVELFWYLRGYEAPAGKERILPVATAELVIDLAAPSGAIARLVGPQSESIAIERTSRDELLGVHFHPGGLFPLLCLPLDELHGQMVTMADLWGVTAANQLLDRLKAARSVLRKFQVLEHWLLDLAKRSRPRHSAVFFAARQFRSDPSVTSCANMADRIGFSQRHFIELFRREIGLGPKLFCRVCRFQNVIQAIPAGREVDWADIALANGYADQSHFNHDFRSFSGLSPTEYLSLRMRNPNHVLVA